MTDAPATLAPSIPSRPQEARLLAVIALPLVAAYLSEYLMFVTTKIVVGSLGYRELAAVGLAGELTFEVIVILMGMLSIIGVLAAQAEGAGDRAAAGQATRQGLIVATLVGIPATVLVLQLDHVMIWTGQDPEVTRLARPFLIYAAPSILPALWFAVLRNFASALSRTGAIMIITLGCVALNYALNLAFVHGRWGFPALGVGGAGLAMSIVTWIMFLALLGRIYFTRNLRGYGVFRGRLRFEPALCREILRLGMPVAMLVALEAGLFVAVGLISGNIGAQTLASHTMIMSWIAIPFVIALGLAEATMVRVAHGVGRRSQASARASGILGMQVGTLVLAVLIIVPLTQSESILRLFLTPGDHGFEEVAAISARLLMIAAIFQVFDGLQAIASRALRGIKDTVVPLWLAAFGYWVLGIGGGSLLAFPAGLGGEGLWWGLATGLIVTGGLLSARFLILTREIRIP